MAEINNGSNDTPDNVENVKVGEHEVQMVTKDGIVSIEAPEGLENDPEFKKAVSAMAIANKKGMETNARNRELEKREADLEAREAKLKQPKKSLKQEIMDELGVETSEELDEFSRSEYLDAQDKVQSRRRNTDQKKSSEQKVLDTFTQSGGDTEDLKRFGKALKAPITPALVSQYNNNKTASRSFASDNIASIQGSSIQIVPKGTITGKQTLTAADRILRMKKKKTSW